MFPLLPCLPCLTGNKGNKYPGDTTRGGSGRGDLFYSQKVLSIIDRTFDPGRGSGGRFLVSVASVWDVLSSINY